MPESRIDTPRPGDFARGIEPFAAGAVSVAPKNRHFRATARALSLEGLTLFQLRIREARVTSPPRASVLSLTMALEGVFDMAVGAKRKIFGPGSCSVLGESEALDIHVSGVAVFVANIDMRLLCETTRKLADADPPKKFRAETAFSLSTPMGVRFWRLLMSIWRDLDRHGCLAQSSGAMAEAKLALAEALIDATGGTGPRRAPACGPAALRRAEEFVLAHLGDPLRRADICAAAAVSERSLSRTFNGRHGVGPMTFLKQRRLDLAQRLLVAADPAEHRVTDIVARCGLYHLGRFSVEYNRAFGESPSETLRR